ncbi:membrane-associated tyrosine- and threonine-specific cdc2-inhibitory kinase [Drosophila grimshawi]|uniref:non-specific serine/threonine protein kinase n=1 Tax=Drosophila grimshawi TaxID=7222 RepID=B4JQK6_DROGR|nr:membrane-associated tyrosine- and threonine-specific cdc2-inhibitory kinase [Drosophila grimshawi]EDV99186.1 GH13714 [Drosophila grimshawi]
MAKRQLPLPEMNDDKHRRKQFKGHLDSNRLQPPKFKMNRSHSHILGSKINSQMAHAISFCRGAELNADTSMSCNKSYFEQCFERLDKLGEGSFGEVFQVRDRSDSRLYAVKISKQLCRSEHDRAERLEEVRRYEELSGHQNCVRFIRAWEQNCRLFVQMELCRESLLQYLSRCRQIPEKRIWHILLDLLRGLKSLHDRNLIHLDIKLDNVLIGADEKWKLSDFGLVIDLDKVESDQATEGDSRYMAPEILQGQFTKAADIFSLGIAILELACYMDLPSNGPLWHELRNGKLPDEFINTLSVELQQVIKCMMTPDPQQRPTAEQLLADPVLTRMQNAVNNNAANGAPSSPSSPSLPSSPSASPAGTPRVELQLATSTPIGNRNCYASDFLSGALHLSPQCPPTASRRINWMKSTPHPKILFQEIVSDS